MRTEPGRPSKRLILLALTALIAALLWRNQDPHREPDVTSPHVATPMPHPPSPMAQHTEALPPTVAQTVAAYQDLAALYGTELAVLNCRLPEGPRPGTDYFFPGLSVCDPKFEYAYDYVDGWFTSLVRAPDGLGGICDAYSPSKIGAKHLSKNPTPDRYLAWQGAGTRAATCALVELTTATIVGVFEHPKETADGIRVHRFVDSDCGFMSRHDPAPEFRLTVQYVAQDQPTVCRVQVGLWFDDKDGNYVQFLVDEAQVTLDPAHDQWLHFHLSAAELTERREENRPRDVAPPAYLPTMDTTVLRERASAMSPALGLLARMQRIRDLRNLAMEEQAWNDYLRHQERWIRHRMEQGDSEEEAEEAFHTWWQDNLDGRESSGSLGVDALGRPVDKQGVYWDL